MGELSKSDESVCARIALSRCWSCSAPTICTCEHNLVKITKKFDVVLKLLNENEVKLTLCWIQNTPHLLQLFTLGLIDHTKNKKITLSPFLRIQRGKLIWLWLWTMSTVVVYRFLAGIIIWTEMMLCLSAILDYIIVFRLLTSRNALKLREELCRDPARSKLSTHQQRTNCYLRVWSF
jgi:hypothetical protein